MNNTPPRVQEWHFHWQFWTPKQLDDATIRWGWWAYVAGFTIEYVGESEYNSWDAKRLTKAGVQAAREKGDIQ